MGLASLLVAFTGGVYYVSMNKLKQARGTRARWFFLRSPHTPDGVRPRLRSDRRLERARREGQRAPERPQARSRRHRAAGGRGFIRLGEAQADGLATSSVFLALTKRPCCTAASNCPSHQKKLRTLRVRRRAAPPCGLVYETIRWARQSPIRAWSTRHWVLRPQPRTSSTTTSN